MVYTQTLSQKLQDLYLLGIKGDSASYAEFLREVSIFLRHKLSTKISSGETEDIIQEILISLHKARHTYDGGRPIMPWLMSITKFRLNDYFRKYYARHADKMTDIDFFSESLADVTIDEKNTNSIEEVLAFANERERQILKLIHIEGYSCRETGEKLDLKENAVKVIAHRAIKRIREKLSL